MTWKEFKDEIDKKLAEQGLTQDVEISWIDIHMPDNDDRLGVNGNQDDGIAIDY